MFSDEALTRGARHKSTPTLGIMQGRPPPGPKWSEKRLIKDADSREGIRFGSVRANKKALELNKELVRTKELVPESRFFTTGSRPKATSGGFITVGTNCSGMKAPTQTFRNLKGRKHKQIVSCDNDGIGRKTIEANSSPEHVHDNVISKDNDQVLDVGVCVAGFPGQQFSTAGKQLAFDDTK